MEAGMAGVPLILTGRLLSRSCGPISGGLLDFWQADAGGAYDNVGFRLRGHQFADAEGRYRLETIVPAQYATRTSHIHVKAQAPNRPVLTTQLYFPDEPRNARDSLFSPRLLVKLDRAASPWAATFDFILDVP
jgi:protocatechuate 3,4-dioxygenase beta subunit